MRRLVHTIALGAAVVALATCVWRDYGAFTALKRTVVAYLLAYFLAGGLGLAARAAVVAVRDPDPEPEPEANKKRSRKRKQPPKPAAADGAATAAEATADGTKDEAAPEPVQTG